MGTEFMPRFYGLKSGPDINQAILHVLFYSDSGVTCNMKSLCNALKVKKNVLYICVQQRIND